MFENTQSAGVGLGHHTDTWFERENLATGQPRGARHSDLWYQRERQRRAATSGGGDQPGDPSQPTGPGAVDGITDPDVTTTTTTTTPTGPTAAELAAAETDRQSKMRARRDEWDRLNNQGKYDPDGWQSIGFQPDPVAMPSWWLDGLELGTTAPAVPLPVPPVVAPPVVPQVVPPVASNALGGQGQVRSQPWTQPAGQTQTAGQSNWGAWGQQPSFTQKPDAGAWGQMPATSKSAGLQSPNATRGQAWAQPGGQNLNLGLWGQKKPQAPGAWGQGQLWGQKPAGTWGSGNGY